MFRCTFFFIAGLRSLCIFSSYCIYQQIELISFLCLLQRLSNQLFLMFVLFVSLDVRVPRSLLPGVRSSRLRDRQKEEREFMVKKGFVEDILRENNMLSVLLEKESSCRAVLWNPDMLPYLSHSQVANTNSAVATSPRENTSCNHIESLDRNDKNVQNFIDEMALDLESMNDIYLDSDDLSCDFQVDSGTLACVACGILGFPFMSVVQPSEKASRELSGDHLSTHKRGGVLGSKDVHCSPHFDGTHPGIELHPCIGIYFMQFFLCEYFMEISFFENATSQK